MSELRTWSREEIAVVSTELAVPAKLTQRQVDVLRLVASGNTYAAIAAQLHVSRGTVRGDVEAAMETLGARRAAQAVALAYEYGVLRAGDAHRAVPGG